jgi:hypothetical protein
MMGVPATPLLHDPVRRPCAGAPPVLGAPRPVNMCVCVVVCLWTGRAVSRAVGRVCKSRRSFLVTPARVCTVVALAPSRRHTRCFLRLG